MYFPAARQDGGARSVRGRGRVRRQDGGVSRISFGLLVRKTHCDSRKRSLDGVRSLLFIIFRTSTQQVSSRNRTCRGRGDPLRRRDGKYPYQLMRARGSKCISDSCYSEMHSSTDILEKSPLVAGTGGGVDSYNSLIISTGKFL